MLIIIYLAYFVKIYLAYVN